MNWKISFYSQVCLHEVKSAYQVSRSISRVQPRWQSECRHTKVIYKTAVKCPAPRHRRVVIIKWPITNQVYSAVIRCSRDRVEEEISCEIDGEGSPRNQSAINSPITDENLGPK